MLPRELGESFLFDYFLRNLKAVLRDFDIDFGSFGFYYYLVLFLVGKKIREDVESRKPRSPDTRHDSIPFCSNFCIKRMVSFNFNLFFTKIVILSGISSTYLILDHQVQLSWQFLWIFFLIVFDWLLLLLSSVTFGIFFFSKREMILYAIQKNELELLELKGIIVL